MAMAMAAAAASACGVISVALPSSLAERPMRPVLPALSCLQRPTLEEVVTFLPACHSLCNVADRESFWQANSVASCFAPLEAAAFVSSATQADCNPLCHVNATFSIGTNRGLFASEDGHLKASDVGYRSDRFRMHTHLQCSVTFGDDVVLDTQKDEEKQKNNLSTEIKQQSSYCLLPKVVIIGRPNVGKSALFNRIVGADSAIVDDEPGVTRDRLYSRAFWGLHEFALVDTGGVLNVPPSKGRSTDEIAITHYGGLNSIDCAVDLPLMIERQIAVALEDAAAVILVVDGQAGPLPVDADIADWLRRKHSDKNIILAVNKCESPTKGLLQLAEFWTLGFTPLPVSAISGRGMGDLVDCVCSGLKRPQVTEETSGNGIRTLAIAIVGRPNVGKSSILNALVGVERTIVSPVSGTTRDAVDTEISSHDGQVYRLIDTAGIRKKAAVATSGSHAEYLSVNRTFRAIRRSDVVALVIDALVCVTEQDCRLGERIEREGKGCVIVVNKWDTIPEKDINTMHYYETDVREKLRVLSWAPIVYITATSGQKIDRVLQAAITVENERSKRLSTATLNQVVHESVSFKQPPRSKGGKKGRIYYCTQAAIRPPTFVFFVNDAKLFSEDYRRYMEKQLRLNVGYCGTPIRLLWRNRQRPEK